MLSFHHQVQRLLPVLLLLCAAARTEAATIDFESFMDSEALVNQIAGLSFSNATVLTAGISLNEIDFPPHSGTNVATDSGGPIIIDFASPVTSFSAFFTYTSPLRVLAFDASLDLIGSLPSDFSSNLLGIGDPGSAPNELITLSGATLLAPNFANMKRVVIAGDPNGASFVMDDVNFTNAGGGSGSIPVPGTLALLALPGLLLTRYARQR